NPLAIVVIGAAGQLGRDLCSQLGSEAIALTHGEIELTDPASLSRVLGALEPSAVLNTAAYNLVDEAERRPAAAFAANAFGVRDLSLVCRNIGCALVHFSTDYVFGLELDRTEPYDELAAP